MCSRLKKNSPSGSWTTLLQSACCDHDNISTHFGLHAIFTSRNCRQEASKTVCNCGPALIECSPNRHETNTSRGFRVLRWIFRLCSDCLSGHSLEETLADKIGARAFRNMLGIVQNVTRRALDLGKQETDLVNSSCVRAARMSVSHRQ